MGVFYNVENNCSEAMKKVILSRFKVYNTGQCKYLARYQIVEWWGGKFLFPMTKKEIVFLQIIMPGFLILNLEE